jgi:hypothetical protein
MEKRAMERKHSMASALWAAAVVVVGTGATPATAKEPCGDFGECKVLIEINATDGDIGFHFLMDGDDLNSAKIRDPNRETIFSDKAQGALREQKLTETFAESAEPFCKKSLKEEKDDVVVGLVEFLNRWPAGRYVFKGKGDDETSKGKVRLKHKIPAAPSSLAFNGSVISWSSGNDLGECASNAKLSNLVASGVLPVHPQNVRVVAWEVVFEPDVEDGDPTGNLVFSIRVAGNIGTKQVTVPAEYLAALPNNTPAKIEVGAIGVSDNATFTEVDGFCINETTGCP